MKVVIDLDLHEAIQDFAVRSPAGSYEFKSQDTIDWLFYFVRNGTVQDLTSGLAIKFGMVATGDTTNTLLAYQTTFTYTTDAQGNICYECPVNFNTSQMATAISGKTQLPCTAEVRYQSADGEIVHTLNISALVFPTILVETGVTPPGVSTGYPDASTLELLVHKDQPSGYAGLGTNSKLFPAQIPVDSQTVVIDSNNNIASGSVLAYTVANFTTPAVNATVAVTFVSTSKLIAGQYIRIPIAGYYSVVSVTDSTHAVLKNMGDPLNALGGVTITSGAALLPAQAVSGATAGQNAFTQTTAAFTVPAVGATVSVSVQSTTWLGGTGYYVFITGAGYYAVNSITDSTHAVLTNAGGPSNAVAGNNIASGATVAAAGSPGAAGVGSAGLPAYDALSSSFVMPAANATVNIAISNTAWLGANQIIYIAGGGYFQVSSILSATQLTISNLPYPGNAAPGATVPSGSKVSPGGLIGAQGAGGPGLNAYTTLTSNFTQPAANATVAIVVGTTAWMATGQGIYIVGGGYYTITSIGDLTHVTVSNVGAAGNATPGSTVTGSGTQNVTPAGTPGPAGSNPYTTTSASFTMPASGSSVTVTVGVTAFMLAGQYVYIQGAGYFTVASITDATHAVLTNNIGATSNVASGTVIASGAGVSTTGAPGPAGPTGSIGPSGGIGEAPTDGQIYGRQNSAWTVVTGGGGTGPIYPSARIFDHDDFDGSIVTVAGPNGKLGWLCKTAGAGSIASGSNQGANSTDKAKGVWNFSGSITGDYVSISLGDFTAGSGAKPTMVPGLGILQLEFRINIGALPTGTQDLVIALGLCNNAAAITTVTPNDAVQFFYWFGNAITTWRCSTIAAATATNTSSGVAATAGGGQWHKFQILTNAGWTSIQFKIDGAVVATNTTNITTANLCPFLRVGNGSSATWASAVYVDYYYHDYQYTR